VERVRGDASVSQWDKILRRVLSGQADQHVRFADLVGLLLRLGFREHIEGSHHVYRRSGVREIVDLQPRSDGKAKAYQVKQVRAILQKYGLTQVP
jgi:predicted RNA binding protein YcfA (HicA-like mRNA interferase family)